MKRFALNVATACAATLSLTALANAQAVRTDDLARGAYISRAGDCMSCHVGADDETMSGGKAIQSPFGDIIATNITPSAEYGIGEYTRDDLARVLRDGKSPDHNLYPAMPYSFYRGMSDRDIDELYVWLMAQEAVDTPPERETELPFPFNLRFGVTFWNWARNEAPAPVVSEDPVITRGQYLVDYLGHCGACHTPRDNLMGMDRSRYLAGGAPIDGWIPPNITSDPISGIGNWSTAALANYLKEGHAMDVVQAGGPMEEVVYYSTKHMTADDLMAMAAYLKTVPAIVTEGQVQPIIAPDAGNPLPQHRYGQIRNELAQAFAAGEMAPDETLYATHCAACHGLQGQGEPQAYYPRLANNVQLRRSDPTNLIRVIMDGVPSGTFYRRPGMPGFEKDLSNHEIAQIANYTRKNFGGQADSNLTAEDVAAYANVEPKLPFLFRNAALLTGLAILLALTAILALIWWIMKRRRRKKTTTITEVQP